MKREEKRVKKLVPYGLWDFTGLQTWLNQQAQAGYALEKWPGWSFIGIAYFKKDPSAVHARYRLDPMQERLGVVELKKREEGYQAPGWNYVGQINRLYAIYRCDDPEAPELYDDADSLSWAMKKQVRWAWISLPIRLYQESVQTLSPSLAQAVYQGRIAAHRRALEKYRGNWEKNTSTLHPDLPDAYDSILEEELFIPDLDGLTRFTYQYSNETTPNMVYIGWVDNRVFVLNCSGAVDSETALTLLTQRLAED